VGKAKKPKSVRKKPQSKDSAANAGAGKPSSWLATGSRDMQSPGVSAAALIDMSPNGNNGQDQGLDFGLHGGVVNTRYDAHMGGSGSDGYYSGGGGGDNEQRAAVNGRFGDSSSDVLRGDKLARSSEDGSLDQYQRTRDAVAAAAMAAGLRRSDEVGVGQGKNGNDGGGGSAGSGGASGPGSRGEGVDNQMMAHGSLAMAVGGMATSRAMASMPLPMSTGEYPGHPRMRGVAPGGLGIGGWAGHSDPRVGAPGRALTGLAGNGLPHFLQTQDWMSDVGDWLTNNSGHPHHPGHNVGGLHHPGSSAAAAAAVAAGMPPHLAALAAATSHASNSQHMGMHGIARDGSRDGSFAPGMAGIPSMAMNPAMMAGLSNPQILQRLNATAMGARSGMPPMGYVPNSGDLYGSVNEQLNAAMAAQAHGGGGKGKGSGSGGEGASTGGRSGTADGDDESDGEDFGAPSSSSPANTSPSPQEGSGSERGQGARGEGGDGDGDGDGDEAGKGSKQPVESMGLEHSPSPGLDTPTPTSQGIAHVQIAQLEQMKQQMQQQQAFRQHQQLQRLQQLQQMQGHVAAGMAGGIAGHVQGMGHDVLNAALEGGAQMDGEPGQGMAMAMAMTMGMEIGADTDASGGGDSGSGDDGGGGRNGSAEPEVPGVPEAPSKDSS